MLCTGDSGRIRIRRSSKLLVCESRPRASTPVVACQPCAIANRLMSNEFTASADFRQPKHALLKEKLKVPALCVGDEEVAENLDARDRLEFLRIDEIGVHRERVGLAE